MQTYMSQSFEHNRLEYEIVFESKIETVLFLKDLLLLPHTWNVTTMRAKISIIFPEFALSEKHQIMIELFEWLEGRVS